MSKSLAPVSQSIVSDRQASPSSEHPVWLVPVGLWLLSHVPLDFINPQHSPASTWYHFKPTVILHTHLDEILSSIASSSVHIFLELVFCILSSNTTISPSYSTTVVHQHHNLSSSALQPSSHNCPILDRHIPSTVTTRPLPCISVPIHTQTLQP